MGWPKGKPFPPESTAKRVATFIARGRKRRESRTEGGVEVWRCIRCEEWLPREEFYADKRQTSGIKSECRRCHCETTVKTRDPDRARDANRVFMRELRKKAPGRFKERDRRYSALKSRTPKGKARQRLNAAVRAGKIARPSVCSRCGIEGRVQGHHPDYSKPLEVEWLCTACHGREHRKPASSKVAEVRR